jgi:uncharacterized membrane protein YeaQ/YmgE (transglycosylase-associated protein family)
MKRTLPGQKQRRQRMIYWLVVGLIAGWLAGLVMKGGGYGILVDILLGIVGGWLGGWLFGRLGIWPAGGMIGSIIVAFVGAVILVGITRLLKRV